MNEQLIKFIELCLMDGVISDKEREVIFRKSKELGVPEDECEIILEGMIQKHQKENQINTISPIPNKEEKLVEHKINIPENNFEIPSDDVIEKLFYEDYLMLKTKIDNKLKKISEEDSISIKKSEKDFERINNQKENYNNSLKKLESWLKTNKLYLFKGKENLSEVEISDLKTKIKETELGVEQLHNKILDLEFDLKKINKEINKNKHEENSLRRELKELETIYNKRNFLLFKDLYLKSPILFQSSLFSSLLSNIKIDNEKQILNLTRYNKFIYENEINYDETIGLLFEKLKRGDLKEKEIDQLFVKRKNLITYYNSFHIMIISLEENKISTYMDVYLELESLGVFNSFFEKSVLEKLSHLNKTLLKIDNRLRLVNSQLSKTNNYLSMLNNQMYSMNIQIGTVSNKLNTINHSIEDVSYSIQQGNNLMREGNDLLNDVRSGIGFNNLLSSIQTYQLYKINKNTRGLRE